MAPRQTYGRRAVLPRSHDVFASAVFTISEDDEINKLSATVGRLDLESTNVKSKEQRCRPALKPTDGNVVSRNLTDPEKPKNRTQDGLIHIHATERAVSQRRSGQSQEINACTEKTQHSIEKPIVSVADSGVAGRCTRKAARTLQSDATQPSLKPASILCAPSQTHLEPLLRHNSISPTTFEDFDASLSLSTDFVKIAEASFSQVFRLTRAPSPENSMETSTSILKLIPLTHPPSLLPKRPSAAFRSIMDLSSSPENVASEVRLLKHLTEIPGFTAFRGLHLLQGPPGPNLAAACTVWNSNQVEQGKEATQFPLSNKRGTPYPKTQLWAVLEMGNAGTDLERLVETPEWKRLGVWAVWDVFWQVVLACVKAEVASKFEHRDLHMGNICVQGVGPAPSLSCSSTKSNGSERGATSDTRHLLRALRKEKRIGFTRAQVRVIDYTISRADLPCPPTFSSLTSNEPSKQTKTVFNNLESDPALFEGDSDVEYQYEMYRYTRRVALGLHPHDTSMDNTDSSERLWEAFHPATNVVWLHFILHSLMAKLDHGPDRLAGELEGAGRAESAEMVRERAGDILDALDRLSSLLDLKAWAGSGVRSAADLIAVAVRENWLKEEDFTGFENGDARDEGGRRDLRSKSARGVERSKDGTRLAHRPRARKAVDEQ